MADTAAPRPSESPIASPMIAALERAWDAIRTRHPELPPVVIVTGSGLKFSGTRLVAAKHAHFHAQQWGHREHNTENALDVGAAAAQRYAEIFVSGEGLARQPHEILASLLHEAAHALAEVRKIQDTSRQGRWHNREFARLADEVGINVTRDPKIGYSVTAIKDETVAEYADTIMDLMITLDHVRVMPALVAVPAPAPTVPTVPGTTAVAPTPVAKRRGAQCQCDTPREVHISRAALAQAPILCGLCLAPFAYA